MLRHSLSPWKPLTLLAVVAAGFVVLGFAPETDRTTWLLENLPVILGVPILVLIWPRFPFSLFAYSLIAVHAWILMIGGHYSYAAVPAGFWVQQLLGLARNPYDRLGHVAQGFIPAILAREVLLRLRIVKPGWALNLIVLSICLSISALYELVEWSAAILLGQGAEQFLGTQGDPWDTQADMACALLGAAAALLLSSFHDRSIRRLNIQKTDS